MVVLTFFEGYQHQQASAMHCVVAVAVHSSVMQYATFETPANT